VASMLCAFLKFCELLFFAFQVVFLIQSLVFLQAATKKD